MSAEARRGGTATSRFGVSRREGHDSSAFYERFPAPETSRDDHVEPPVCQDRLWVGDARCMSEDQVADNSVALVVTSPPYFAGKEYEEAVGKGHVPASYQDYLQMLRDVFAACSRKLEPGGRIAVNVANLGRRPYRSLSSDVIGILQDDLGLLLRGEVIWQKARGAAGNCAWGSFQRPGNPVLRDLTERVVIASKGRFDRALSASERAGEGLPSQGTAYREEFMEATTDVWEIEPASATRVGHPAPFPVELPQRLIDLYTYRGDLVLDPFMGAGTTAMAAVRTGRYYVGFDTDADYVALAEQRIAEERERLDRRTGAERFEVSIAPRLFGDSDDAPATSTSEPDGSLRAVNGLEPSETNEDFQARAVREGRRARVLARDALRRAGFEDVNVPPRFRCGVEVNFRALDKHGQPWLFLVSGAFTVTRRPGLRRIDTLWKVLGKAAALHASFEDERPHGTDPRMRLVLLTTDQPAANSAGHRALQALMGQRKPIHDVIGLLEEEGLRRLAEMANGEA